MLRTCAGCRETEDPAVGPLVRAVVSASGEVVPDLARKSFGRGAWVHARPACLAKALPRGISKSMKMEVRTGAEDFALALREQAERRALALLTAAFRARKAALGSTAVRDAFAAGRVSLLVVATDARAAADTPWVDALIKSGKARAFGSKELLGRAVGRPDTGVIAILDRGISDALAHALGVAEVRSLNVAPPSARSLASEVG